METNNFVKPMLTEPGVKYFINATLKQCHQFREKYMNTLFNIGLLVFFILSICLLLTYKYKGKLTPQEREHKDIEKKQFILSKIHNFQQAKLKSQQSLITGLPQWETEYDILDNNRRLNL